jgi:hypothetical protein
MLRANATAEKPAAGHRPHDGRGLEAQRRLVDRDRPGGRRARCPGCACAAGHPKTYAMRFDRTSTATVGRASREARMVIENVTPQQNAPAVPTAGVLHPTRDIHARVRRCNVHVKRQKSRVERLPIRPARRPALKRRRRQTSRSALACGASAGDTAAAAGAPPAFTIPVPLGRVAQWESARFTRERSQVRNPPRPLESPDSGVPFVGVPVPNGAQSRPSTRALRHALSSSAKRMACASTRRVNFGSVCPSWSTTCRGRGRVR